MRTSIVVATALLLALGAGLRGGASGEETKEWLPFVDSDGTIHFPGRVREKWAHLGSWGSADLASADPGQHDVYTQPESLESYRKTGRFPDGAVVVKEVRKIESGHKTTGPVTWAGDEVLWFVMIKDAKGRFPENGSWGEGWGWALFNAGETEKNASSNFRASCLGCHVPARDTDWIYVQGYPALRAVHERAPGEARRGPSDEMLRSLVDRYAHAVETNNRELALAYLHPRTPQRSEIDAALRDQLGWYLERARTLDLERLPLPDGAVAARVDQQLVRVFGMKFTHATRRSIYRFRELGGSWRIWRIDEERAPQRPPTHREVAVSAP